MRAANSEIITVVKGLCGIIKANELLKIAPGIEHIVAYDQEVYDAAQVLLAKLESKPPRTKKEKR